MEGIKQQKLPRALWNLDRIDKRGSALNGIYRYMMQTQPSIAHRPAEPGGPEISSTYSTQEGQMREGLRLMSV